MFIKTLLTTILQIFGKNKSKFHVVIVISIKYPDGNGNFYRNSEAMDEGLDLVDSVRSSQ